VENTAGGKSGKAGTTTLLNLKCKWLAHGGQKEKAAGRPKEIVSHGK